VRDRDKIREEIVGRLKEVTWKDDPDICDSTEIFYELDIYGEDLVDEILWWVHDRYGTDFSEFDNKKYAPSEAAIIPFIKMWFGKRPFKSFKVKDLVDAAMRGQW